MIWSLGWRPRLIIPRDLWKSLDELQRSTLIVHELAHLRRGDHRVRYFELFVTALFWWHPLVWWVRQVLRDVEEQCCDAWVVWAFPEAARSYAETLLETIDFLDKSKGPEPLLASGFGKVHHLRKRLTMILNESTPRRLSGWGMLGLFGLAAMMLPVNATWAQKPEEPQIVDVVVKAVADHATAALHSAEDQVITSTLALADFVTIRGESPDDKVVVDVKTDDSPNVVVTGSKAEVIERLKVILNEVQTKSSLAGKDHKLLEPLRQVVEELTREVPQIKADVQIVSPNGSAEKKVVVVRSITADSPKKPLSIEEKAEVEKLQAQVAKLNGELQAKQKELAEAQSRLAKLQGVIQVKVFAAPLVLHSGTNLGVEKRKAIVTVPGEKVARKTMVLEGRKTLATDSKAPTTVEVKKVDPTNRRVEIHIGSDDGLVGVHELKLPQAELKLSVLPQVLELEKKLIETHFGSEVNVEIKPSRAEVAKSLKPSEQQQIEELEKKLKALLDEVANLKKGQTKGPSRK